MYIVTFLGTECAQHYDMLNEFMICKKVLTSKCDADIMSTPLKFMTVKKN